MVAPEAIQCILMGRENLTDDEAKKIEAYLQEKEEYRAKIKAIK